MLPYDWFMSDSGTRAGRQKKRGTRGQGITRALYWISCLGNDNKVSLDQNQHQTSMCVRGRTTHHEDAAGKYNMMYSWEKNIYIFLAVLHKHDNSVNTRQSRVCLSQQTDFFQSCASHDHLFSQKRGWK